MKVGDKILCIKEHSFTTTYIVTKKDKIYTILEIYDDGNDVVIVTTVETGQTNWSTYNRGSYYLFSDYFITLSELRNKKLKKINENR